ncbi:hypothetical protein V1951_21275 [Yersinia sp. 2544 StPb PI]|uniref:hypothetical protein n=1 Tax=Yersinia TaxID=629 RepID=UPI0005DF4A17|nr:hypothetical protein [Yersinia mollaretii]CNK72782.1 Uncharacterised protein [Yersinia enterocolitica]
MNKALFLTLTILLLSGCANSSKTFAPDGREAHSIDCSGLARTWGMCLEKAGDICGAKGYDTLTSTGDHGAVATANQQGAFAGSVMSRNLLISCKK